MTPDVGRTDALRWYCLRARVRREHVAAGQLQRLVDIEVYAPRIRFRRMTRRGRVWFEEALFPGYLFGRFDLCRFGRIVQHAPGVTGMVRFGSTPAVLEDAIIAGLRADMGGDLKVFEEPLKAGDRTVIVEGPLRGLEVTVQCVLPASERIKVLFEFLGRPSELTLEKRLLEKARAHPLRGG